MFLQNRRVMVKTLTLGWTMVLHQQQFGIVSGVYVTIL